MRALLASFIFCLASTLSAETNQIEESSSVLVIEAAIENAPEETLFIFDVGNVLLSFKDPVLRWQHRGWMDEWFIRNGIEPDVRLLTSITLKEAPQVLVNPAFPSLVEKARQKGTVIALSKNFVGSENGSNFEDHVLKSLSGLNIDFDSPFPYLVGWIDEELNANYSAGGLLLTDAPLKGPVLISFLNAAGLNPNAIVFIDDRKDQCQSIFEAANELNIPVHCINYTEAMFNCPPLDVGIAEVQLQILVEEHRWPSDEEVQERLLSSIGRYERKMETSVQELNLVIKTLTGMTFNIKCSANMRILEVKQMIEKITGFPAETQRLIYAQTQLKDELTLHDYNITDGAVIHLVLRLRN